MAFQDHPRQARVTGLLQRSLYQGRLAHAYLFSGNDLGELESLAATLAKVLHCSQTPEQPSGPEAIDCCDHCNNCRRVDQWNHPDVHWLRPESKTRIITIDQTRDLMHHVHMKPTEAGFKVAILSGVDRMNTQAANAFLKTLEEPPARSVLILLTTEPHRLLDTILSRCLRLNFMAESRPVLDPAVQDWLGSFAHHAASGKPGLLARYRLLGDLASRLESCRKEIRALCLERSPLSRQEDLEPKLRERLEKELDAATEAEYRRRRSEFLSALQLWLRDVWMHSAGVLEEEAVMVPQLDSLSRQVAARMDQEVARTNLDVIEQLQSVLFTNAQEALALEVGLLKIKL